MPILFFIDKDILDDPVRRNIDDVVLSYTFFRSALYPIPEPPILLLIPHRRARRNPGEISILTSHKTLSGALWASATTS